MLWNSKRTQKKVISQKTISLAMAEQLQKKNINVIPGYKLCKHCFTEFKRHEQDDNNGRVDDEFIYNTPSRRLNTSLTAAEISPINLHAVASHSRRSSASKKLSKIVKKFKHGISSAYDIDVDDLNMDCSDKVVHSRENTQKGEELDKLYNAMREKLISASYPEKIQILTLIPDSWSRKKCAEFFDVSEYLVRVSRELKKKMECLRDPTQSKVKIYQTLHWI